jgi:hypothetical protein
MSNPIRISFRNALELLVAAPLNEANDAALADLARHFWYSNSNIKAELKQFLGNHHHSDIEMRRLGYLLERFCRFACASNERVIETFVALAPLMSEFRNETTNTTAKGRTDSLSSCWGLRRTRTKSSDNSSFSEPLLSI